MNKHWTQLAPGVYVDADQALHLVVSELLTAHGFADTPENRETLVKAAQEMLAAQGTAVTTVED